MRKITTLFNCFIVTLFVVLFFAGGQVIAQTSQKTPEEIAREKGITFPIAELGNCTDFNSCRTFCEDPVNRNTCIDFAKKKGFHKEESNAKRDEILNVAKNELGCDSEDSCRSYCSQETNYQKCSSFAQNHNLEGGQAQGPSKSQILEKAKKILGCDSPSSCKSFCEQEANREKCSEFAKQTGLRGGEHEAGPGGCNSEETCRKFCSDPSNFEICQKFHSTTGGQENFHGPGGCNTPESCRAYCEKNPQECEHIGGTSQFNPQEVCNKTPSCSWTNNTCQCSSFGGTSGGGPTPSGFINPQDYCRQYPEKCKSSGYPYPTGSYSPYPYPSGSYSPYPSYSAYPSYSPYPSGSSYPSYSPYPQPTSTSYPNYSPAPSTTPPTTTTTQPTSYDPATECAKHTGCSWTGSTCSCQSVQGAKTQRNLFQTIFQTLLRL